jgi:hypothetical protein
MVAVVASGVVAGARRTAVALAATGEDRDERDDQK